MFRVSRATARGCHGVVSGRYRKRNIPHPQTTLPHAPCNETGRPEAAAGNVSGEGAHQTAGGGSAIELPVPSTCWSKSMMEPVIMPDSSLER
jgi:hypothetical protein